MSDLGVLENSFIQYNYTREVESYDLEPFGEEDNYDITVEVHILHSKYYSANIIFSSYPDYDFQKEMSTGMFDSREEALLAAEKEVLELIKQHKNKK